MTTQLSTPVSFLNFWQSRLSLAVSCLLFALLTSDAFAAAPYQLAQAVRTTPEVKKVEMKQDDLEANKKPADDTPEIDTSDTVVKEKIGDRYIRFHMWDGSIMGGEISVDQIEVETEFGILQIPIGKILKFHPGLDSLPTLNERLQTLVENLGDKDFETREQAHRELVAMGALIRNAIDGFDDGGSAERKKHLAEIKKQINEIFEDFEVSDSTPALIQSDTVVTEHFTIVGRIKQDGFTMGSKFGELNIKLTDIKLADRTFNMARKEIRKSVDVGAKAFFQTDPVSTKIRVNAGDKISIRASGTVKWTNWNTSCGPDGQTNQGQWEGINSGTLTARIGKSGKYVKVGAKGDFLAKESGVLYLGVAIRDTYAKNSSYRWNGNYTAKITVRPASK